MKVEIWSDFTCPYCYIGRRRFEHALANFPHRDRVQVIYRSFELNPEAPKPFPYDVYELTSKKFGISRQQVIANYENLMQQAAAVGLDFRFDGMIVTNTFDAHRLCHYAEQQGKGSEVSERLYRAYFSENKNISDHDTLADLAADAGLNREDTLAMLAGAQFFEPVREEEAESRALGIRGVPFYAIDRKLVVSGAQSEDVFLSALQQAWNDWPTTEDASSAGADACIDGTCSVD